VVSKISGTGYFSQVDTIYVGGPGGSTTPTLTQLEQYSAVLVFSDYSFSDPTTLGNNLASYVNGGGGVVVCFPVFDSVNFGLGGSFVSGYLPFTIVDLYYDGTPLSLVSDQPLHPILAGVNSFSGGTDSFYSQVAITSGSSLVAHWNNGYPLVATKGHVVGLNFYPPSSDAEVGFWISSTDGAKLMANSLAWAGNVSVAPPFPPQVQTVSMTGGNFQFSWNTVNTYPPVGYQVQYTTNLAPANWINLGGVLTGSGPTISTTDTNPTGQQRYYRVLLVQ
jgi:hypothetical protein